MLTREVLKSGGAISVTAISLDQTILHGYWHEESCLFNECWLEAKPNDYIIKQVALIIKDNGYRYTDHFLQTGEYLITI
jgi:hypothetical protein